MVVQSPDHPWDSKAGTQNSNSSVTPKTENVENNDQQSLYNSLDDLTKRLEKLVEAKNELLGFLIEGI